MDHYFVDTSFLVARFNPRDANHAAAREALTPTGKGPALPPHRCLYSDYVFDETVTTTLALTRRHEAAKKVGETLRASLLFRMARVDEAAFEEAWLLFRERPEKEWSFTDCTSFVLMERLGLKRALSFDRNFREAGFATFP